jgi:DNA-directed RNA polymerase specialized sigma24 family protein
MAGSDREFNATRWTLVLRAKGEDTAARAALSELCAAYYAPVVAFLRPRSASEDAAREQAHAFFAEVLEGGALTGADPGRGRFRSYLLGALKHFLADARDRSAAAKRGGGVESVPLDAGDEWNIAGSHPDESAFDREWALTLLSRALTTVGQEWADAGKAAQFEVLKPALSGTGENVPIAESARQLGISEGAAKVAIHRLRARFREVVKGEIAQTVPEEADVDDELRYLVAVLAGRSP